MEKSRTELLTGIEALDKSEPFPDEVFESIFDIEDTIERQKYIEDLRRAARGRSRLKEFDSLFGRYREDYIQKQKRSDRKTRFTDQALELYCGEWIADDMGVRTTRYTKDGAPIPVTACSHPILPIEILKNVDTSEERLTLAYFKNGAWQKITADRSVCADNTKIVSALSRYGIEVTSENAKHLVRYISDCVGYNPTVLAPKNSIGRLGWVGTKFMPYETDIRYEGDPEYRALFEGIGSSGDFGKWRELCGELRGNEPLRILMDASFASALVEPLRVLPFACHVWGPSGTCKTVALMVAMSVWGNPKPGGLVKTMNMTKNAIMQSAAFLYSLPFAGDELQTVKDRWSGNFDQLIYQITEGVDRGRAKLHGGVEETRTWRNAFLFTGEEPITKQNSAAGSKNRVIEIALDGPMMEDGHYVSGAVQEHYGYAGRMFVEHVRNMEPEGLRKRYRELFGALCELDTTDKQAMAMACILVADGLAGELFWPGEAHLDVSGAEKYLHKVNETDVPGRALEAVLNWAAKNPVRFMDPRADDPVNRGETWGKIEDGVLTVNRDVLSDFLQKSGYDYAAVTRQWAGRGDILKNSQGRYVHQTKVYGIRASYIRIPLPEGDDNTDADGFMSVDPEQGQLPF